MHNAHATRAAVKPIALPATDPVDDAIDAGQQTALPPGPLHHSPVHPDDLGAVLAYLHGELQDRLCQLLRRALEIFHG